MQSGIVVGDDIRQEFQQLRMKRKHRYIIYAPSEDKSSVVIEKIGERGETWEQFIEAVPKQNSR
jgi:cofilin